MATLAANFGTIRTFIEPITYRLWPGEGPSSTSYDTFDFSDPATLGSDDQLRSQAGSILVDDYFGYQGFVSGSLASIDWVGPDLARITSWLPWNAIKSLAVTGTGLAGIDLRNFVEIAVDLSSTPDRDVSVRVDGAKRGTIVTAAGDDQVTILADSNGGPASQNQFVVQTGGGDDRVTISASVTDWTANSVNAGVNRPYDPRWTVSEIDTGDGDDQVTGGEGIDRIMSGGGADRVQARGGADVIQLGFGDDEAWGGAGNDVAEGDLGRDTWRLSGLQASYSVTSLGGGQLQVRDLDTSDGDDGTDLIRGFERLVFADGERELPPTFSPVVVERLSSTPSGNAGNAPVLNLSANWPSVERIAFRSAATDLVSVSGGQPSAGLFAVATDGTAPVLLVPQRPSAVFLDRFPDFGSALDADETHALVTGQIAPGLYEVELIDAPTGARTVLTSGANRPANGDALGFSPDGDWALFRSFPPAGQLYHFVSADNTEFVTLPSGLTGFPVWSADGNTVALGPDIFDLTDFSRTTIRDENGDPVRISSYDQFLTSDGSQIIFGTLVVDRDGTDLRRLGADLPGNNNVIAVSPDDRTAVIASRDEAFNATIYLVELDGSNLRTLAAPGPVTALVFSQDGSRVLYSVQPTPGGNQPNDLYLQNVDGTGLIQLVSGVVPFGVDATIGNRYGLSFSPDETRILFESRLPLDPSVFDDNGASDVFVINTDGTGLTCLSVTPEARAVGGIALGFTSDGTGVVFLSSSPDLGSGTDTNGGDDLFVARLPTATQPVAPISDASLM